MHYFSVAQALGNSPFGEGTGPIVLNEVNCSGKESRLSECSHQGIGVHNCVHLEDAGVRCLAGNYFLI